jgi:hypothetical protein
MCSSLNISITMKRAIKKQQPSDNNSAAGSLANK